MEVLLTPDTDVCSTLTPSRRTLVTGAAWALPVVAVGSVAPAACVGSLVGAQLDGRPASEPYPGCGADLPRFAVSVQVVVTACAGQSVCLRVYDLGDEDAPDAGLRSRLWWSYADQKATPSSGPPFLFVEKCVTVRGTGTPVPVDFAVPGDDVRSQTAFLSATSSSVGNIGVPGSGNAGIHVNPCFFGEAGTTNRVARFFYRYEGTGPWVPGGYILATRPA